MTQESDLKGIKLNLFTCVKYVNVVAFYCINMRFTSNKRLAFKRHKNSCIQIKSSGPHSVLKKRAFVLVNDNNLWLTGPKGATPVN